MPADNHNENAKRRNDDRNRTAFDTEMIRAATHQYNYRTIFVLANGETIEGVPIVVDRYFLKIKIEDGEIWVGKNQIATARVFKEE